MAVYLLLNVVWPSLGGAWLVLHRDGDLLSLVILLNLVQVIAAMSAGVLCRLALPAFHFRWVVARHQLAQVIHLAWPFAALSVLAVIYQRLGILLLSTPGSEAQAGWLRQPRVISQ
jgi:hypothetical protein